MPNGFPAALQHQYPQDLPPTLFHPASPKVKPAKPAKSTKEMEMDSASMLSTSTFSSSVSLLKEKARSKLPVSYKEYKARKEAAAASTIISDGKEVKQPKRQPLGKDTMTRKLPTPVEYEARRRTAEAYMLYAMTK